MSKKAPTKAEEERMAKLADMGCIVTRLGWGAYAQADIHHLTSGGRRRGHAFTIPLAPWFHRAVPDVGMTPEQMRAAYGPSLAENKKEFEARWGTEEYLLQEVNKCLGLVSSQPLLRDTSTSSVSSTTSESGQPETK